MNSEITNIFGENMSLAVDMFRCSCERGLKVVDADKKGSLCSFIRLFAVYIVACLVLELMSI